MSYQVLSRKWRPKNFEDVVGQSHVTRSIQNAITKNRLGHAYVLTGTRGIGKTSVARIFAKSLRCLERDEDANPCGRCRGCEEIQLGSSMNVFEIDGASNNSVDDIRDLVNNVQTLPTFGDYKIYIIDEVHMLSTSAFNALLKTLEEPPEHTIFLLATTEPHKLLDTVLSRCIRLDFRNASVETLVSHIKQVSLEEKIEFKEEKLIEILAQQGKGSFRDTLSLLDQVLSFCHDNVIDEERFSSALGLARLSSISSIGQAIIVGDHKLAVELYNEMLMENVTIESIATNLLDFLYSVIKEIDNIEKLNLKEETIAYLKKATIDEVFWLYESMSKDFSWGLTSLASDKVMNIIIQKHSRRSEILKGSGVFVERISEKTEKKSLKSEEIVLEHTEFDEVSNLQIGPSKEESLANKELEPIEGSPVQKGESWEEFEVFLRKEAPAIFTELEHGNIIEKLKKTNELVAVEYGFSAESKLFYDHLVSGEGVERIENMMRSFFDVPSAEMTLTFLEKEEVQKSNFQSKSEILEERRQDDLKEKEDYIRNHPVVKEAEKLFSAKIDKIKIQE